MSYYATHRKNILDSIVISRNDIQPGDILEFRYKGKDKNSLQLNLQPLTSATIWCAEENT